MLFHPASTRCKSVLTLVIIVCWPLLTSCSKNIIGSLKGDQWVLEKIASGNQIGLHSSITTTSDGAVIIGYHDALNNQLHIAERQGPENWTTTQIDSVGWHGENVYLYRSPSDSLFIFYRDSHLGRMRYAIQQYNLWESHYLSPVESLGDVVRIINRPDGLYLTELDRDRGKIYGAFQDHRGRI
ncbi:hypothetical protein ACFL41_01265 [Gemmatimonadota bacterium]